MEHVFVYSKRTVISSAKVQYGRAANKRKPFAIAPTLSVQAGSLASPYEPAMRTGPVALAAVSDIR